MKKESAFKMKGFKGFGNSPAKSKVTTIEKLPVKKLPTRKGIGYGNRPIDFERGGYGGKLDPKRAGFPGRYIPIHAAKNIR